MSAHTEEPPAFDGDPDWRVVRHLRDGRSVTIRPVTPADRDALRQAFLALSPESRYLRFLNAYPVPSDELFTYLTDVDQQNHVALCATIEAPDLKSERGIGIARFIRLAGSPDTAEAAVTVVDDMVRVGVATALLRELLRAAEVRGVRTLRGEVLAENTTMRGILERAGATPVAQECGAGTMAYDLALPPHDAGKPGVFDVLRGAAETMALRFFR